MKNNSVLTGDVINSRNISDKIHFINTINEVFRETENRLLINNPIQISRGDSFQTLLKKPSDSLKAILLIKSGLMSKSPENFLYNVRISVGIGSVEFPHDNINIANGKAFELSGIVLESMKKKGVEISIVTLNPKINKALEILNLMLETIINKWSKKNAEVVYLSLLHDLNQIEIAQKLKISQSAIQQRLVSANFKVIISYINFFENIFK